MYANIEGKVFVNDSETSVSKFRDVVGFGMLFFLIPMRNQGRLNLLTHKHTVPQDDIMHSQLTIREILHLNAMFRLQRTATKEYRKTIVDTIIAKLGLWDQRNDVIGNEFERGLSGGGYCTFHK